MSTYKRPSLVCSTRAPPEKLPVAAPADDVRGKAPGPRRPSMADSKSFFPGTGSVLTRHTDHQSSLLEMRTGAQMSLHVRAVYVRGPSVPGDAGPASGTGNRLSISVSSGCRLPPVMIRECSGPPKSTVHICCRVPAAIRWSSAPTRARPTHSVSSVRATQGKKIPPFSSADALLCPTVEPTLVPGGQGSPRHLTCPWHSLRTNHLN